MPRYPRNNIQTLYLLEKLFVEFCSTILWIIIANWVFWRVK